LVVAPQRVVSIRYIMRSSAGEELENNIRDDPLVYLHGAGSLLPELENGLTGLQPGDKKSFSVYTDSFPGLQDEMHFEIVIDDVRKATDEEIERGMIIDSADDEIQDQGSFPS
jgi:FKBP-type peptidyl-prolyl cis-trans isomerase SlyD